MLVAGSSDLATVIRVAEGLAATGANLFIMKCRYTYDLIEMTSTQVMLERLLVIKEEDREPEAIWVEGKRTK